MLGAEFIKFHELFQKLLVMGAGEGGGGGGGGGRHSSSTFYSVKLCVMINFSLYHNVLCVSYCCILYSIYKLYAVIKMVSLMKQVVMCNKNLRLKCPLKVNRPLEFIEAP